MSNPLAVATGQESEKLSVLLKSDAYANRFKQVLGERAPQFVSSLIAIGNSMPDVEPRSIIGAAMTAACLDLPIDKNLGFAWIVPYRDGEKKVASFQLGARGYVQLGLRSAQYERMNATAINREVFLGWDAVGEPKLDWDKYDPDQEIWGYFFGFVLVNGFTKTAVWTKEKVTAHARRYSQAFRSGAKIWKDQFDGMALKTVVANTLRKWGPLSVQMQQAFQSDQTVIRDIDAPPEFIDVNDAETVAEKPVSEHPEIAKQRAAQEAQQQKVQAPVQTAATKKTAPKQAPAQKEKPVVTQAPPPPEDWAKVAQEAAARTSQANVEAAQPAQPQTKAAPVIETTATPVAPAEDENELAAAGLAPEQPQPEPEPENVVPMQQVEPEPTSEPETPAQEQAAPEPKPAEQTAEAVPEPELSPAQALLKKGIEEAGFTFDDMVKALAGKIGGIPKKNDPRTPKSFGSLEEKTADWLSKNVKGVVGAIKADKAKK